MLCPVCKIELKMSERSGVEIDYCPQCRGVWLDRGELDKIIDRAAPTAPPVPAPAPEPRRPAYSEPPPRERYRDDDDERRGYHGKKKKSFLEDIFDF